DLLHFSDQRVGVLLLFFQARNFVAGLVALSLELFRRCDQLAPLSVQSAERVEIQRGAAFFCHFGEYVEMLPKIAQVMHRLGRIAEEKLWRRQQKQKCCPWPSAFFQRSFDRRVGFVNGQEDRARIVHAQGAKVGQMKLLAGQRQMNFANIVEVVENSFAHRIERVLERLTIVLGKSLEQHLSYTVP